MMEIIILAIGVFVVIPTLSITFLAMGIAYLLGQDIASMSTSFPTWAFIPSAIIVGIGSFVLYLKTESSFFGKVLIGTIVVSIFILASQFM